jgi:nucleoside-triphosphatase
MKRHIILVGPPGCGKTTVIRRTVDRLRDARAPVFGFWTAEIRDQGIRRGFQIETLLGVRSVMAHVDFKAGPKVSKYGVNVEAVNRVAVAEIDRALREGERAAILVMDEIGKMELMSPAFRAAVASAIESPLRILATAMSKAHPFVDGLKRRPDVEVVAVSTANRDSLPEVLAGELAPQR